MWIKTTFMLMFLVTCKECSCSTEICEKGSTVCLQFNKLNAVIYDSIKRENKKICVLLEIDKSYTFKERWRNGTFNCNVSAMLFSVCFEDCQPKDAGLFALHRGQSDNTIAIENITLKIATPVTSVTLSPTLITLNAGQKMNLTCATSYCYPPANVTWYMSSTDISPSQSLLNTTKDEDSDLMKTTSTLQRKVMAIDDGKWVYCSASNIPGRSVNSTFPKVTVEYKPEVISNTSRFYSVKEGQSASLNCAVKAANPNTNIIWRWFRKDRPSDTLHNGSTYTILGIMRNKAGSYNCAASNVIGTSDALTITVDVQYKPEVTSNTSRFYSVKEGQNATLDCAVKAANPDTNIIWRWFRKDSPSDTLHNGSAYTILGIMRNKAGSYNCAASNSIGTSDALTITVDVQYIPKVRSITPSKYSIIEGQNAKLECAVTTANPNTSITWRWFRTDSPSVTLYFGPTFNIFDIPRNNSGSYNCTARNSVGTSIAVTIEVDIQYRPEILRKGSTIANESDRVILAREIVSNPLSNVSWYKGKKLLKTENLVKNATLVIKKALCTDTKNFTLVAGNTVDRNVTAFVELIVNCKPQSYKTNITLGVTDTTGIEFSTTVIAYPEPQYKLERKNGTINNQMMTNITRNAVNNFTINFRQDVIDPKSFGIYHLNISNSFGNIILFVNVLPQRKPYMPENISIVCDVRRARVQWKSSFNGGDPQSFTVKVLSGQASDTIPDNGENEIHFVYVQNLQPSTTYVFYVSAKNSHGSSYSEYINCTTVEEAPDNLPLIAGSAAASGITFGIIIIIVVVLFRKYTMNEQNPGKSQRFENNLVENDDAEDDGLKDNILYVSADQKDDKPEGAVYAAVNKKESESNNNSNIYAEVNKSDLKDGGNKKKGFFRKDEQPKKGERTKQNKGKKKKSKQDAADVYENSEDIAMSSKSDNVYSNTRQKVQNKEERGYKNKDGLLYVEVQFDANTEKGNQTIHGEEEKTDYATVEFPMAASTHDESGNEKI